MCRALQSLLMPRPSSCMRVSPGTPCWRRLPCQSTFIVHTGSTTSHRVYAYRATAAAKVTHTPDPGSQHTSYRLPESGLLSILPRSWVPYAELARLDKPVGTYYLLFPCLFSTLMAAPLADPIASPSTVLSTGALFAAGALIMRGAGCTINDLWDRNHDPHVERTRLRPIARGAVTPHQAVIFTGVQLLGGLVVLLHFPFECFYHAVPSLPLVLAYPLAKRVTDYPQVVLGLAFSWGAIMGFPALGINLLEDHAAAAAAGLLYASNIAWTVLYDMIYAYQDLRYDRSAGIRSIALRHAHNAKPFLACMSVTQTGLLAAAGFATGAGPLFYLCSCGGAALTTAIMIRKVRLGSAENCWWWFRNGCWFTGLAISGGLAGDYVQRRLES